MIYSSNFETFIAKYNWTECSQLRLVSESKGALYGLDKEGCFWNF